VLPQITINKVQDVLAQINLLHIMTTTITVLHTSNLH